MAAQYSDRVTTDEFSQLSKSIAADLQRSSQLVRQLQSLSSNVDEPASSIMKRFREADALVKDVAERMKTLRDTVPPIGKQERAKMERQRLQDSLVEVLTQLKDIEKQLTTEMKRRNENEKKRLGEMQSRNSDLVNVTSSPTGASDNPFFDSNGGPAQQQANSMMDPLHQVQIQQQQVEYNETLQAIQERDRAMQELEEGVTQVNEIFKDMAQLIHDQGDVIDNIETQIDKAESSARLGNQNLGSAVKHQRRGSRTKIMLFGILGAIVLVIVLIIVIKLS